MFSIFRKSKPKLSEIIPKGFVDIHSHILPSIDDGAKNVDESVILISNMKSLGFSKIIATPHIYPGLYNNTIENIRDSYNKLMDKNYDDNISYASEYFIEMSLIEKAEKKSLLTLNKNYVLLEMGFISSPINLHDILFKIQLSGYVPILAHPERYPFLYTNFSKYTKLKDIGCKFQLNLLSILGFYGADVLRISNKLLSSNLIDYAGSDIHNVRHIDFMQKNFIKSKHINKIEDALENNKIFY